MRNNIIFLIVGFVVASVLFYCGNGAESTKEDEINNQIAEFEKEIVKKDSIINLAYDSIDVLSKRQDSIRTKTDTIIKEIEVEKEVAKEYSEEQSEDYLKTRFGSFNKTVEFVFDADILEIEYRSLQEIYEAEQQKNLQNQFIIEKQEEKLEIKDTIIDKKDEVIEIKNAENKKLKRKIRVIKGVVIVGGAGALYFLLK